MTRILIADDHEVVRSGLRAILETQEGWEIVAEAADGMDAVAKAKEFKPDVAVVDYSLPVMNGTEVAREMCHNSSSVEVLIFTMHEPDALIGELIEAGARGYLLKSDAKRNLIAAVKSLAAHKPFFTAKIPETVVHVLMSRRGHENDNETTLSPREKLIVQLIAEGHSNRETAEILNLSVKTIETHRASAMRKLNLTSTAAIVRYAVRNRLV